MDYVEVGVHYDYYSRTWTPLTGTTRDRATREIFQSLRLRVAPLGLTVRFLPTAKRHKIVPYVGGGVDALFYKYEEFGDFIDFQRSRRCRSSPTTSSPRAPPSASTPWAAFAST